MESFYPVTQPAKLAASQAVGLILQEGLQEAIAAPSHLVMPQVAYHQRLAKPAGLSATTVATSHLVTPLVGCQVEMSQEVLLRITVLAVILLLVTPQVL